MQALDIGPQWRWRRKRRVGEKGADAGDFVPCAHFFRECAVRWEVRAPT